MGRSRDDRPRKSVKGRAARNQIERSIMGAIARGRGGYRRVSRIMTAAGSTHRPFGAALTTCENGGPRSNPVPGFSVAASLAGSFVSSLDVRAFRAGMDDGIDWKRKSGNPFRRPAQSIRWRRRQCRQSPASGLDSMRARFLARGLIGTIGLQLPARNNGSRVFRLPIGFHRPRLCGRPVHAANPGGKSGISLPQGLGSVL
jgi:hypothetical protein